MTIQFTQEKRSKQVSVRLKGSVHEELEKIADKQSNGRGSIAAAAMFVVEWGLKQMKKQKLI